MKSYFRFEAGGMVGSLVGVELLILLLLAEKLRSFLFISLFYILYLLFEYKYKNS